MSSDIRIELISFLNEHMARPDYHGIKPRVEGWSIEELAKARNDIDELCITVEKVSYDSERSVESQHRGGHPAQVVGKITITPKKKVSSYPTGNKCQKCGSALDCLDIKVKTVCGPCAGLGIVDDFRAMVVQLSACELLDIIARGDQMRECGRPELREQIQQIARDEAVRRMWF